MLVDVVTEFADEVVRPAAAEANETCAAPEDVLKASLEIGLPILGVPESLGGISEERSAMAGTLVAEALARGDMGLAVAALAPGSVATAHRLWGTDEQQQTYLPAFTGDDVPAAALALTEPDGRSSTCSSPSTTAIRSGDGYVLNGVKSARRRAARTPSSSSSAPSSTASPRCSWSSAATDGPRRSRATRRWACAPRGLTRLTLTDVQVTDRAPSSAPPTARRTPSACGSRAWPGARSRSAPARPCSTT